MEQQFTSAFDKYKKFTLNYSNYFYDLKEINETYENKRDLYTDNLKYTSIRLNLDIFKQKTSIE